MEAGNIITLALDLDLNGILHVSAQEKATGLEKSITIKNALSQFESTSLDTAKQRITGLFGKLDSSLLEENEPEQDQKEDIEEIKAAKELITKAENLFDEVSTEDKEDMVDLIETLTNCIEAEDIEGLDDPVALLTDIIFYLES